jgi:flagellar basal body-associated protein FliL
MNTEYKNQQMKAQGRLSWIEIVALAALLLVSLGGLIYFFVVSTP